VKKQLRNWKTELNISTQDATQKNDMGAIKERLGDKGNTNEQSHSTNRTPGRIRVERVDEMRVMWCSGGCRVSQLVKHGCSSSEAHQLSRECELDLMSTGNI
jgi:hypothetical protein